MSREKVHDDWQTPPDLLDKIRKEFGEFFDPCPLYAKFDGLSVEWGKVNFINPPYSRKVKEAFIQRAFRETFKGNTSILLLPVSTSSDIFHHVILPYAEIRFIKRMLKFIGKLRNGEVSKWGSQHDSMLVIFRGVWTK